MANRVVVAALFAVMSSGSFAPTASAAKIIVPFDDPSDGISQDTVHRALAIRRAKNFQVFEDYQAAGVFPQNTGKAPANIWRDKSGHLCAAATMIDKSGQHALVDGVAKKSNNIRLGDVKAGPLMDWIETSGFTQAEVAAIQVLIVQEQPPRAQTDPVGRATAFMRSEYSAVSQRIANAEVEAASLDAATELLMKSPALAAQVANELEHDEAISGPIAPKPVTVSIVTFDKCYWDARDGFCIDELK